MARDVESRIAYMADPRHWPGRPNRCAETTWKALDVPRLGAATAAIAADKVKAAGHLKTGPAPRGAVMFWKGGHSGAGHMAMSLGHGRVLSTDVNGAGKVGEVPFDWFARHWPAERYVGWSDWYSVPLPMETRRAVVANREIHNPVKPPGQLRIKDGSGYVTLDVPKIVPAHNGFAIYEIYLNVSYVLKDPAKAAKVRVKIVREAYHGEPVDPTAYKGHWLMPGFDNFLITQVAYEIAEAHRPLHVELRVDGADISVGTRYFKGAIDAA